MLSPLQKYIINQCALSADNKISKTILYRYYGNIKKRPKQKDLANDVTKSVDRLIKKELVIGYGWKTARKWFIEGVKLTAKGKKIARGLFGVQQKLPFKILKSR